MTISFDPNWYCFVIQPATQHLVPSVTRLPGRKIARHELITALMVVAWKQVIEKRANPQWALAMFRVFGSIVSGPLIMNIANSAFPKLMSVIGTKADQNHAG